jgi:hypothetical protein
MSRPKSDIEKLTSLLDAIEESILQTPDEEIIKETQLEGEDPDKVAGHVNQLIASHVKNYRQKKLRGAKEGYRQSFSEASRRFKPIPKSPSERRALLTSIMNARSDVPAEITVAWRQGQYISDDDVIGLLEDLAQLGFLEEDT